MMYRKLGFAELAAGVLDVLRQNTGYDVYDAVPEDAESPFLFVEVVGKRDSSSKTTWKETFVVNIHCIAKPSPARTEVYEMIHGPVQLIGFLFFCHDLSLLLRRHCGDFLLVLF